ncbi:MAG: CvpA family protein [Spirochaetales bacterium]|nr:CvpA family protein [Spirochaetales bacterium]
MNLPLIDLIFIVIIAASTLIGFLKGFLDEVLGKVIPIASIFVAFMGFKYVLAPVESHIKIHVAAVICAFLLVFIVCFIVLKIVQVILKKIFSASILKSLDRFLGLVFGLVEGVAVVCIILLILTAQPWFNSDSILKGSLFLKYLEPVISVPKGAIRETVNSASAFIPFKGAFNV